MECPRLYQVKGKHTASSARKSDARKGGMWKTKISKMIQIQNMNVTWLILNILIPSTYYYYNLQFQNS